MAQPRKFLLQIVVTVNTNGTFTETIFSYFDGTKLDPTEPLPVNIGDQVAWLVQVLMPNGRKSLPYILGFSIPSFFGVSSLAVPAGGASPFLPVLALQAKCSYTLNVTGLGCVFDPDIQSGSDSLLPFGALATTTAFHVTWDTVANTITWTSLAFPTPQPFPMQVAHGDKVDFTATAAYGDNFSNFALAFTDNNIWLTPFEPDNPNILADPPTSATIGPLGVSAPAPSTPGTVNFPFVANVNVNGTPVASPAKVIVM